MRHQFRSLITHRQLSVWAIILAVVLCSGLAQAQQNNSTRENARPTEALREKAFALLESVADQINTLQSTENRARLGSNIAESLWNHDEKRARTLLVSVENDIKAGLQNQEGDEPTDTQTRLVFLHLRVDTVERIARHDADLALTFLKATELSPDVPRPPEVAEAERALELRLANQVAGDNPELALKLGRQSLARGYSEDLLSLLTKMNKKHKEQALMLYKEIVLKLRSANLAREYDALYFASNLARSFAPPAVDDTTFRDLIGMLLSAALANGCGNKRSDEDSNSEMCYQIGSLLPQMEKIDPLRAARLKQWAPDASESDGYEGYNELNDLTQNGTVDEVLALATKYPQMKDQIYIRAMMMAKESGDVERARKIAKDYDGDPERRQLMLDDIERDQEWAVLNDEKRAEVQRELVKIPRIQDRVMVLLYLANRVGANDRKVALDLLNQASGIIDTMKPGKEQTESQMALAMMYCVEKSDRGLGIMESMLPKINDLVSGAVKLDGYDNRNLRDGEWNMSGAGSIGSLLAGLAQNAGYFAWCDFDRAVSIAAQFERPELRLMAQLKLAQGILAGPPKRLSTNAPALRYY